MGYIIFLKIKKVKPLSRLTKNKRKSTQIHTIRDERAEVTSDTIEIQKIVKEYYKQSYANKLDKEEK